MKKTMSYKELNPVIAINILNFNLFHQTNQFHTTFHLYEDQEQFKLTDLMEFHFIEMSKLISDWKENKLDPWNDVLARWLLMLGMVDRRNDKVYEDINKELRGIAMKDKTLHTAMTSWEKLSTTHEEALAYEARLKRVLDEESIQREMELRYEEGMEKALKEGMAKGIEQGIREEKEAIARQLLTKGMDIRTIAEITGLEKEQIIEIQ